MTLQAPFPYFGGKSRCAASVWQALGRVTNFVDPFAGSCAVLLARPQPFSGTETINDIDAYLANFWRAVKAEPEAVAELMNDPINECEMEARHKWLVTAVRKREHRERMRDEHDYYDAKIAAYWCWGLCQWIGRGWCSGEWNGRGGHNSGDGINVRDEKRGGKRPQLRDAGQGVHRKLDQGRGELGACERHLESLIGWMRALQDRLRHVRVCCGDWSRVCTPTPTFKLGLTGMFFDPPYSGEAGRDNAIYAEENLAVAHDVRDWCLEHGRHPLLRIVLAGYEGEHNDLDQHGWRVVEWKAHGGMGVQRGGGDYQNKYRERLWLSPHCCGAEAERTLFS